MISPDAIKSCEIRYRNKNAWLMANAMTGPFYDPDDVFWLTKSGKFVLSAHCGEKKKREYAVPEEPALEFIGSLLECEHSEAFRDGENTAIIRINGEYSEDTDPQVLQRLVDDLWKKCGEPINAKELYGMEHPIPDLPEEPYEIQEIVQYTNVQQPHPSLPVPPFDTKCSRLNVRNRVLVLYREEKYYSYHVPQELGGEIYSRVRELLVDRNDGYCPINCKAAYISMVGSYIQYYVSPEAVYDWFTEMAGKCGEPYAVKEIERPSGMIGLMTNALQPMKIVSEPSEEWTCSCGAKNSGKFCRECGAPKNTETGEWTCSCGAKNSGKFCRECGTSKNTETGEWTCGCGAKNSGKFCRECGTPKNTETGEWACSCGAKNSGKFCRECGAPKNTETGEWTCSCGMRNAGKFCQMCGAPKK